MAKTQKKNARQPDVHFPNQTPPLALRQQIDDQGRKITEINNVLVAVVIVFLISFLGFVIDSIRFHGEQTVEFKRSVQENRFATDEVRLLRIEVDKLRNNVKEIQNQNTTD